MSLLVVILLVSVAAVVSFALLRGESTAIHIQQNADLRDAARHAAMSGLTYGVRAMHHMDATGWQGVDTSQTRTLGPHERFTVTFAAGDPSLQLNGPDSADYAYRVTVESTGCAEDPNDVSRRATHTVRAVVRLVPRALSSWTDWPANQPTWPTDWYKMEGFSIYQTKAEDTSLNVPCQLRGNMRFQAKIYVGKDEFGNNTYPTYAYPSTNTTPWYVYLSDLRYMAQAGGADCRPIVTPRPADKLQFPYYSQDYGYKYNYFRYVQSSLLFAYNYGVTGTDIAPDWLRPTGLSTYQIYPGGPLYDIPTLSGTQENVSYGPDPLVNPLGLYYHNSSFTMQGSATIHGTLFCNGDLTLRGHAQFQPVDMPALCSANVSDEPKPVRLPVLTANNILVESGSTTSIAGLVAAFDRLEIKKSPASLPFNLKGRLVTGRLYIREREPWDQISPELWPELVTYWRASGTSLFFPQWLGLLGLDPTPYIVIGPDATPVLYHWNNWDNPIYAPHEDDGGLRWEMLEWNDRVANQ